jgi:plasmid maintenance system antidote protein VapI
MGHRHNPTRPGEAFKYGWPEGVAVTGAARQIGVIRVTLSRDSNGQVGVIADMALGLQGRRGIDAGMRMRAVYFLWHAEQQPRQRIEPRARRMTFRIGETSLRKH